MADTLFADVSEFQAPLNDSYTDAGYRWLSIRSNDGTYRDHNWRNNWDVARRLLDTNRLHGLIVYFVCRPNWEQSVETHLDMMGEARADVVSMIDAESWGGEIVGDHSHAFNSAVWRCSDYHGGGTVVPRQVIGYLNPNDHDIWPDRPEIPFVVPSYGAMPQFTVATQDLQRKMFAHQYTNGEGFGHGLPEGAPPFGNCDMNAANGRDPLQLRNLLIGNTQPKEDDMSDWQNTPIPTQYINDNGVIRLAGPDDTNNPNRIVLATWDLLSRLDGRVARIEANVTSIFATVNRIEAVVNKLATK